MEELIRILRDQLRNLEANAPQNEDLYDEFYAGYNRGQIKAHQDILKILGVHNFGTE